MSIHCGICCPFCYSDSSVSVADDFDKNPYPIYCPVCGECVNEDEIKDHDPDKQAFSHPIGF